MNLQPASPSRSAMLLAALSARAVLRACWPDATGFDDHGRGEPGSAAWFSGLVQTGPAKGSNPGGSYKDPKTGDKWYVKRYANKDQAAAEQISNAVYRKLGATVPTSVLGDGGQFATKWEGGRQTLGSAGIDKETANKILDHYAADAFLANWDAVGTGHDNVLVADGKNPLRVDQGGTLTFRAQGGLKPEAGLKGAAEWDSLHGKNHYYREVWDKAGLKGPDDPKFRDRAEKQVRAIVAARPVGGWAVLAREAAHANPKYAETAGAMLEARQKSLEARVLGKSKQLWADKTGYDDHGRGPNVEHESHAALAKASGLRVARLTDLPKGLRDGSTPELSIQGEAAVAPVAIDGIAAGMATLQKSNPELADLMREGFQIAPLDYQPKAIMTTVTGQDKNTGKETKLLLVNGSLKPEAVTGDDPKWSIVARATNAGKTENAVKEGWRLSLIHEAGHVADAHYGKELSDRVVDTMVSKFGKDGAKITGWLRENVSEYASRSPMETVGEVFAMAHAGMKVPKELSFLADAAFGKPIADRFGRPLRDRFDRAAEDASEFEAWLHAPADDWIVLGEPRAASFRALWPDKDGVDLHGRDEAIGEGARWREEEFETAPKTHIQGHLGPYEVASVRAYTANAYDDINGTLRGTPQDKRVNIPLDDNPEPTPEIIQSQIKWMDSALSKSVNDQDVVLWRGVRNSGGGALAKAKVGDIITDKGYVSLSARKATASDFSVSDSENAALVSIRIPRGANLLDASRGRMSSNPEESEFILPRGTQFKLIDKGVSERESFYSPGGKRYTLEVVK